MRSPRKRSRDTGVRTRSFSAGTRSAADRVIAGLVEHGIEARRWWGQGRHRHPTLAQYPRAPLPVTDDLAARTVGLPFFVDMTEGEIARVAGVLAEVYRPDE